MNLHAYARRRTAVYVGMGALEGLRESEDLLREIDEYLLGRRITFTFAPDFSAYNEKERRILLFVYEKLGYGRTTTYGEIGKNLGISPRVVGKVLSRNRHLLLIPCHRVVSVNGLGGYVLGADVKHLLLQLEAKSLP
ncbi:MAG: MGMT family protein [Thermotogae bacterium]|nr:MGMT family protein [Thermotogota bacterium]